VTLAEPTPPARDEQDAAFGRVSLVSRENWIAALPQSVREAIHAHMRPRSLKVNEELYGAGDPSLHVHQVVDGFVRTVGHHANGDQSLVMIYGRGNCFTETAVVAHRVCNHTTIAMTNAEVSLLPRDDFWRLYRAHPQIPESLCRKFALGLSRTIRNRELRVTRPLSTLVAMLFADLAETYPLHAVANSCEIAPPITQSDLAAHLGVTRQSIQREITALKDARLVEKTAGHWRVVDMARLLARAR